MSTQSLSIRLPNRLKSISMKGAVLRVKTMMRYIRHARIVAKQRQQLAQLSSEQLKDIGISREEAHIEASRDFWDIPEQLR